MKAIAGLEQLPVDLYLFVGHLSCKQKGLRNPTYPQWGSVQGNDWPHQLFNLLPSQLFLQVSRLVSKKHNHFGTESFQQSTLLHKYVSPFQQDACRSQHWRFLPGWGGWYIHHNECTPQTHTDPSMGYTRLHTVLLEPLATIPMNFTSAFSRVDTKSGFIREEVIPWVAQMMTLVLMSPITMLLLSLLVRTSFLVVRLAWWASLVTLLWSVFQETIRLMPPCHSALRVWLTWDGIDGTSDTGASHLGLRFPQDDQGWHKDTLFPCCGIPGSAWIDFFEIQGDPQQWQFVCVLPATSQQPTMLVLLPLY